MTSYQRYLNTFTDFTQVCTYIELIVGSGNETRRVGSGNETRRVGSGNETRRIGSGNETRRTGSGNETRYIGTTVEPLNNGHSGDRPLVHCRAVIPISEVMPCMLQSVGGKQFVHSTEDVPLL